MKNVIELFPNKDIVYITGDYNEPDIVGVKCDGCSIELAPDLHGILVGEYWITREQLIAFVLATGIYDDIKRFDK